MKQLVLVTDFWPTRGNPITGIFVAQQAMAYARLGYKVVVLAPQPLPQRDGYRPFYERNSELEIFSPRYPRIPQFLLYNRLLVHLNVVSCALAISKQLRGVARAPLEGVHVHGVRYVGLSLPRWRKHVKKPVILTIHGVDPYLGRAPPASWMQGLVARMCQHVDKVTLVGSPLKPYSANLGIPLDKVSVVSNGTDLPLERIRASTQRPSTEKRVVLSVSNLAKLKGIDINLRALAQISSDSPSLDWEYRIVGDGPERETLKALAADLGIQHRVSFLGRLPYAQTMKEMANCDVFSLPSWGEAFGIVYLEGMARCRPVLGCLGWGAEEVIRHDVDGLLVPEKDVSKLAEALQRLLLDPYLCSKMGEAGRERVEAFTWERNARNHLSLIN